MKYMLFGFFGIILFGISLGTAFLYAKGFHVSPFAMRAFLIIGTLMPVLFIGTFLLGRTIASNNLTNLLYTIVMILGGMIFYLFIGGIVLGIVLLINTITHSSLPLIVPWIIFGASIALGLTGLVQARMMKVVHHTVILTNAPENWSTKTAVLISDTHYGQVNREKFARRVINKIIDLHPDFVLHAGDFYDGTALDTTGIASEWKRLTATIPVFYAPGNHEEYGPYDTFISSIESAGVTVLADKEVIYDGVHIAGVTYHDASRVDTFTQTLLSLSIPIEEASILINHAPTLQAVAESAGIDLMVSGHTHNGQFWPNNYVSRKVYGAFGHGLAVFKTMQTITTSGIGSWGPPFRTFNTPEIVVIHFKTK